MLNPVGLDRFSVHITVTPAFLFGLLALLVLVWAIFTVIIRYHWKSYGTAKTEIFSMNFFYLTGSAVFIIVMGVFALYYLSSAS